MGLAQVAVLTWRPGSPSLVLLSGGGVAAGRGVTRFGGGVGLQPGLESKVVFAVYAKTIFNLFKPSAGPLRQVKKPFQPLFLFFQDQWGWRKWQC